MEAKDSSSEEIAEGKYRSLSGISHTASMVMLSAMPIFCILYIFDIHIHMGLLIYREQYLGLFLALVLASTFLNVPGTKTSPRNKLRWYDVLLVLLSFIIAGNIVFFYPQLVVRAGLIEPHLVVMGGIAILLVLESVRRIVGYPLVAIGILLLLYARFAFIFPGLLHARGVSWPRLLSFLYLDHNSLLGIPTNVAGTIVLGFLFFGACLFMVGGGKFLTNLALALMGKSRGGPAKVSVVASALFGSLSGSSSANVAVTGVVTIPLMKRTGYQPHFAGAVEATASTGGLVLPPVMAVTAFMIAEFLGIPYYQVAIAAAIPAILYYVAVFTQVHLEAVKAGLVGLPPEEIPSLKAVMKQGWVYIIPVLGLLYFLFWRHFSPAASAVYSAIMMLIVGLAKKENRRNIGRRLSSVLQSTGRQVLVVGTVCALAGLVIGSVSLTNLGLSLSKTLVAISGGNSFFLLLLAAAGAIVLGMGMPIAATYIMLVILIAPALVEIGIEPLAAHFFINYFGAMSFVTPPVCIAAYVAAGLAGSEPIRTAFTAMRLGVVAYIVPFVFCYSSALLLMGSVTNIFLSVVSVALGIISIAIALEGYLFQRLNILKRVALICGGVMLLVPQFTVMAVGFLIAILLILREWRERKVEGKRQR